MEAIPKPEFILQYDKISSLSFLPEIQSILLSSSDGRVSFFSFESQRLICEFKTGQRDLLIAGGFFIDENDKVNKQEQSISESEEHSWFSRVRIVCQFKSGDIVLYRIHTNKSFDIVFLWKATTYCFARIFFSLQEKTFGFLSGEQAKSSFEIVNTQTFQISKLSFDATNHGVITSSFYWTEAEKEESKFILLGDETGSLTLYEHKASTLDILVKKSAVKFFEEMLLCFDFHSQSKIGVAGSVKNEIILWNLQPNFELKLTKRITLPSVSVIACSIRPDGRIFSLSDKDGQFRIMSLKSGKALATISFHTSDIKSMSFEHINGKYLLFTADEHTLLSVWSFYN